MLRKPTRTQFSKIVRLLTDWGTKGELKEAEEAWLQTKVVSRKQYESVLRLLEIFAQHLSMVANQLVMQRNHASHRASHARDSSSSSTEVRSCLLRPLPRR